MKYDYLIIGSGLFGSVFARELTDRGKKCLVIDKRNHIGGNIYTENIEGINVHRYGPHIFHTNNDKVWEYINKFTTFNHYVNRPKINYKGNLYSFPINLFTLYQVFGVKTPQEAENKLKEVRIPCENPKNLEDWVLSQVGKEIYEIFIKGYTKKQWGRDPKDLPSFIIKRLPIRLTFDDNYYFDKYQGIPIGGYTQIIQNLLKGIEIKTNVDYFKDKEYWNNIADKIVFTGKIDEFYDYKFGDLQYRSLKHEETVLDISDFQGNALMNYTDENVEFTRIIEHKHFEFGKQDKTVITTEYPEEYNRKNTPFYPINDDKNNLLYRQYKELSDKETNVIFGGRLAEYKYYDMDQIIGRALYLSKNNIR